MSGNQRSTGNTSRPRRRARSNGQRRSTVSTRQVIIDRFRGGREVHTIYENNRVTRNVYQDGILVHSTTIGIVLGLTQAEIDRVSTTFTYAEPTENSSSSDDAPNCSICQESFKADECIRKLRCGHEFHSSCLVPWLLRQTTCPNCRRKLPRMR